ncbi:hypothetical protein [Pontibacter roseus]|uniref:hypothetical protein n=1 Tax=Pontibacter roseus TaxID=336989 RepID=UPI00035D8417|nr:hypothetical protein [Pontibacter roseus]
MKEEDLNYFLFIKIGEEKHIDALQRKGHFYCTTIRYFRTVENDGLRGDLHEGKAYLKQLKDFKIRHQGRVIGIAPNAQLYYNHPDDIGNIFCIYGVKTKLINLSIKAIQRVRIEEEAVGFGKAALLIYNLQEFVNRIEKSLKELGKEYNISPIHYYDSKTYEGELSPFFKDDRYSYQNEFRLWIPNKVEHPFEFYIGDISDISHKIPIADIDKIDVNVIKPTLNKV